MPHPPFPKWGLFPQSFMWGLGCEKTKSTCQQSSVSPCSRSLWGSLNNTAILGPSQIPLSFPLSPGLMRSEVARLDKMGQFSLHWRPSVVSSGKHHYGGSVGHCHAIWEKHSWGCGLQLALRFTLNGNVLPKSISSHPGLQNLGQAPKLTIQA